MFALMLALQAAAGAFAGPQPIRQVFLSDQDYPDSVLSGKVNGSARIALTIDPAGRPRACAVVISSGAAELDQVACRLFAFRARFKPAHDADGAPVASVWTTSARFYLPGNGAPPASLSYDAAYPVNRLPSGIASQIVAIEQLVDADGHVEGCRVATGSGSQALDALACRAATTLPIEHVVDASGRPTRAVVSQKVLFTTPGEPARR